MSYPSCYSPVKRMMDQPKNTTDEKKKTRKHDNQIMHDQSKITAFMSLRANGWSLDRISRELQIPKTTLWDWDNHNQEQIQFLKHVQLESLQEKFVPSYEHELARTRSYLDRVDAVLEKRTFQFLDDKTLLHMAFQLRSRLAELRDQLPLRPVPRDTPATPSIADQNASENRTNSPEKSNVPNLEPSASTT